MGGQSLVSWHVWTVPRHGAADSSQLGVPNIGKQQTDVGTEQMLALASTLSKGQLILPGVHVSPPVGTVQPPDPEPEPMLEPVPLPGPDPFPERLRHQANPNLAGRANRELRGRSNRGVRVNVPIGAGRTSVQMSESSGRGIRFDGVEVTWACAARAERLDE